MGKLVLTDKPLDWRDDKQLIVGTINLNEAVAFVRLIINATYSTTIVNKDKSQQHWQTFKFKFMCSLVASNMKINGATDLLSINWKVLLINPVVLGL